MLDIIALLGTGNFLAQALQSVENDYLTAEKTDEAELARRAGIELPKTATCEMAKYSGRAFQLLFEADLPATHKHYWCAELFIGEHLDDDTEIPIYMVDDKHEPILEGELRFYGLSLVVRDGQTVCTFGALRRSLTKPLVAFKTEEFGLVLGRPKMW